MNEIERLSRASRLVYYDLYRSPSLDEFSKEGFLYEKPNVIFRKPNGEMTIDYVKQKVGKNNSNHYYSNRPKLLKEDLKKGLIRVKKHFDTSYLYRLLHYDQIPLMFRLNGLKVIVYPKKDNQQYEHDVYVEGIHQRVLNQFDTIEAPIHKKWFTSSNNQSPIKQEWRYLLQLDRRTPMNYIPENILGEHFLGVYALTQEDAMDKKKLIKHRHGNIPEKETPIIYEPKLYVLLTDGTKIAV